MDLIERTEWENRPESKKLIGKDDCIFCINDGEEKQYILKETDYWSIRNNKYPYYSGEKHLMVIPKSHKEFTYLLSDEELIDYKNIEIFMKEYYEGLEYYSFVRQTMGGRSIMHLHYHYLPGKISYKEIEGEKFLKIKSI